MRCACHHCSSSCSLLLLLLPDHLDLAPVLPLLPLLAGPPPAHCFSSCSRLLFLLPDHLDLVPVLPPVFIEGGHGVGQVATAA